ncbi:MAG: hypothetical protein ACE37F_10280 [Nannocystaceae bacterium]
MTNPDFAALVRGIEPLRACFIVEAASGALHREFTRGPMPVEPAAVARAVAGLARAQTDIVGLAEPATLCTLEWPSVRVIVRSVSASALVIFFFEADTKLGVARMHITNIVDELDALLPSTRPQTMRAMPSVAAPADVEPSPAPEPEPEPAPEPAPATSPFHGPELLPRPAAARLPRRKRTRHPRCPATRVPSNRPPALLAQVSREALR